MENGEPEACVDGSIRSIDVSVDGRVVSFESDSNRHVPGDSNRRSDIFVWQAGSLQRASVGANGEQANHGSDIAAISGNGRYLYFRSFAGNLAGTQQGSANLYLKDLANGRLALLSRGVDGAPINDISLNHFTHIDANFSGRYAVFADNFAHFVQGVDDFNHAQDIFLVDVDPDGNGDYFDSAPQIHLLSAPVDGTATNNRATNNTATGNAESFEPSITQDGRAVVWLTRATDLAPGVDSNGYAVDVVLARLGTLPNGDVDPATRTLLAINRMGNGATNLTPQGALLARIDPWRNQVAFVTTDNIPGTGDNHDGHDLYLSVGSSAGNLAGNLVNSGGNTENRQLLWVSHTYSSTAPLALSVAWDPLLPPAALSQVAWVAQNNPRTVDDLLLQRAAPLFPPGWSTVNWIDAVTPSSAAVTAGALSADGRFALWTTTESYGLDVPPDSTNLFRRQIAPAQSVPLTIYAPGGEVTIAPAGLLLDGTMHYSPTTVVTVTAAAETGYRFCEWVGVDQREGRTATVIVYGARTVTATFDAMTPPALSNVALTVTEDSPLQLVDLPITDPDPDESHTVTVAQQASHGTATVSSNVDNNTIHYQPAPNFSGQDQFALQITDAYGLQLAQAALVTVEVLPVNDAPLAASAQGSGASDGAVIPVFVTVQDPDQGDTFTLTIETPPTSGTVQVGTVQEGTLQIIPQLQTQARFNYVPVAGFSGVDHFTFRVADSGSATIIGTATVTVTAAPPSTNSLHLPTLRRAP